MDNVSKALALARLGIKVFPVRIEGRAPAIDGGNGFYDATSDDFEKIATWFTLDYPDPDIYAVGYWAGGSGLLVLDIDRNKPNQKDGFVSLAERELGFTPTHAYQTMSGGEHHIYATDRDDLTLSADHEVDGVKLRGVDIRAGGSYAVWWADEVPESRDVFSTDIPEWITATAVEPESTAEGFSGTVEDWLEAIPGGGEESLPSSALAFFLSRIPKEDFGHPTMVDLAWEIVRLGSERETGIRFGLKSLKEAWLRGQYDTKKYRRDFDLALIGAIKKAGRVQNPLPSLVGLATAMQRAIQAGIGDEMKAIERQVSGNPDANEIDFARARREMFKVAKAAGLGPSTALSIVVGSTAFKHSKAPMESVWFGDGEPEYHETSTLLSAAEELTDEEPEDPEEAAKARVQSLAEDSESFSFLDETEQALVLSSTHEWWGSEYLKWVQTRLKHYNQPYHVGAMWAALSVMLSSVGKVPLPGAEPTNCNLYLNILGESSSGKSEAWLFGMKMIDTYFGMENSPIIADIKKSSALSVHRTLILRDGKASLIYSDEVQSFFEDLKNNKWQGSILGDMSDYYGGNVPPKNTMNDKEISGKRAKTMLTSYFTGIADMTLDAVNIGMWRSGLFYRYLWGFGYPRKGGDYEVTMEEVSSSYTAQFETWAREFKRVVAMQSAKWGPGRIVKWEKPALERITKFNQQLDETTMKSPLHDTVFVPSNGRFLTSIIKCATIVAMSEAAETVNLRHVLIALQYAGPWHRSMVLAVDETGKEAFDRDVEKCLAWIKRNAVKQVDKKPVIQRSAVMRAFRPNEVADRLLRQLSEEGWLRKHGDYYELEEE